jgi:tetratricopeptide (TPR) repeat protein
MELRRQFLKGRRNTGLKRQFLGGKSFLSRSVLFSLVFCFISLPLSVSAAEDISLQEKLEGLNPQAKIAYLRYLLQEEGPDRDVYFQMGVYFQESSARDSALFYYRRCIQLDSSFVKAYVNMGVLFDVGGNISKAIEMYHKALDINEDDVLALSHAAFLHFQLGNYPIAQRYLLHALEVGQDSPQPHFYLAVFFWENKIYREAFVEWNKVIELAPESFLADRARENINILQSIFDFKDSYN